MPMAMRAELRRLRVNATVLVMLAAIPALAVIAYSALAERRAMIVAAEREATRIAVAASAAQERIDAGAHGLLAVLARVPLLRYPRSRCNAYLAALLAKQALYANLLVIDSGGNVVCSARPLTSTANMADRAFFRAAIARREFVMGDYATDSLGGAPVAVISARIHAHSGAVRGVVVALLDLAWFDPFAQKLTLPVDTDLVVIDKNGTVLAHYPRARPHPGESIAGSAMVRAVFAGQLGATRVTDPAGIDRFVGYAPLRPDSIDAPRIAVGIPSAPILRQARQLLLERLGVVLTAAAMLAMLVGWYGSAYFVERPLTRLRAAAHRLAAGDFSARSNASYAGPVGEFMRAFDEMASALEQRTRDMEQVRAQLRQMLERITDAFVSLDRDWRYTYVNERAARMFGRDRDALIGKNIWDEFPEGVGQPFYHAYHRAVAEQRMIQIEEYYPPWDRWYENRIFPSADGLSIFFQDITERKHSEQALTESRARLQAILDHSPIAVYVKNLDGRYVFINAMAEQIIGRPRTEVLGKSAMDIFPERTASALTANCRRALAENRVIEAEETLTQADGDHVFLSMKFPLRDANGRNYAVCGVSSDITERKRFMDQLAQNAQRLHQLSQQLLSAQEDERRYIARELHDEIGQGLTVLSLQLQSLKHTVNPTLALSVDDSLSLVSRTLEQVRAMSLDLRPSMLDDLGLEPALRWYADRLAQRSGVAIDCQCELPAARLDGNTETTLFRIAQEAMTNAVRHGKPRRISVRLAARGGALELEVRDDGVGFDPKQASEYVLAGKSMGLLGMRERAELLRGRFDVEAAPGGGTRVRAVLPLTATTA